MSSSNFLAIIPARSGSERLPHKNKLNLCGKPLISWTIEAAKRSKYIDKIAVTSDDSEILKIANEIKVDFNVHNATDEINEKFSGDLDVAQDFYLGNITKDNSKLQAKEFVKRVALSDGELKDKEVRFLARYMAICRGRAI